MSHIEQKLTRILSLRKFPARGVAVGTRLAFTANLEVHPVSVFQSPDEVALLTIDDALKGRVVVTGWELPVAALIE